MDDFLCASPKPPVILLQKVDEVSLECYTNGFICVLEGWRETLNNSLGGHINKVEDLSDVNPSATLGNVARVRIVKWLCFKKLNEEKKLRSPSDLQPGEAGCRPGGQIFTAWIEDTGLKQ